MSGDGTMSRHYLDCSEDKFIDNPPDESNSGFDCKEFLNELAGLGEAGLDFKGTVRRWCNDNEVEDGVRRQIINAIGG